MCSPSWEPLWEGHEKVSTMVTSHCPGNSQKPLTGLRTKHRKRSVESQGHSLHDVWIPSQGIHLKMVHNPLKPVAKPSKYRLLQDPMIFNVVSEAYFKRGQFLKGLFVIENCFHGYLLSSNNERSNIELFYCGWIGLGVKSCHYLLKWLL